MKKVNNCLIILLLILFLIISCKKEEKSDLKINYSYYIHNDTYDTLICKYIFSKDSFSNILYPKHKLSTCHIDYNTNHYGLFYKLKIYHLNDTNIAYIIFEKNLQPNNYKHNYFNENDWEKNQYCKTEIKDGLRLYTIYNEYSFTISTDNIINLK